MRHSRMSVSVWSNGVESRGKSMKTGCYSPLRILFNNVGAHGELSLHSADRSWSVGKSVWRRFGIRPCQATPDSAFSPPADAAGWSDTAAPIRSFADAGLKSPRQAKPYNVNTVIMPRGTICVQNPVGRTLESEPHQPALKQPFFC